MQAGFFGKNHFLPKFLLVEGLNNNARNVAAQYTFICPIHDHSMAHVSQDLGLRLLQAQKDVQSLTGGVSKA